jgi:hypothetical protein
MRNIDNTFVNELVAGAGRRQMAAQEETDEAQRVAGASGRTRPVATSGAAPLAHRRAAPRPPVAHRALGGPTSAAPVEPVSSRRPYAVARREPAPRTPEQLVPTSQMRRESELHTAFGRLVLPIAVLLAIAAVAGSYVALGGAGASGALAGALAAPQPPAIAVAAPAPVAPAAAPSVTQIAVAPALVDVRIESTPPGATVMLVDRGRTQLVGATPVDAAVDPAREYDLVFTYAGGPPRVQHLDPAATRRVSVALGAREPAHRARSRKR